MIREFERDVNWFIEELINQEKESAIIKELEETNIKALIMGLGTKKGNRIYQNWRRDKIDELEEIKEKDLTVFEKLKRSKERKSMTLFDKLRYFRKGR